MKKIFLFISILLMIFSSSCRERYDSKKRLERLMSEKEKYERKYNNNPENRSIRNSYAQTLEYLADYYKEEQEELYADPERAGDPSDSYSSRYRSILNETELPSIKNWKPAYNAWKTANEYYVKANNLTIDDRISFSINKENHKLQIHYENEKIRQYLEKYSELINVPDSKDKYKNLSGEEQKEFDELEKTLKEIFLSINEILNYKIGLTYYYLAVFEPYYDESAKNLFQAEKYYKVSFLINKNNIKTNLGLAKIYLEWYFLKLFRGEIRKSYLMEALNYTNNAITSSTRKSGNVNAYFLLGKIYFALATDKSGEETKYNEQYLNEARKVYIDLLGILSTNSGFRDEVRNNIEYIDKILSSKMN